MKAKTLANGTTTACYFATLYAETTLLLADAAIANGQRAFIGKVNMTESPEYQYVEREEELGQNTRKFVQDILRKKVSVYCGNLFTKCLRVWFYGTCYFNVLIITRE